MDITFNRTASGVRWILPRRDLGKARWVGMGAIGMGVLVLGFMALWMGLPLRSAVELLREGKWFGWLLVGFAMLGLPMLAVGLGLIGVGIAVVSNRTHAEVEIRNGRLIGIERVMGLAWKRKRKLKEVERLTIRQPFGGRRMGGSPVSAEMSRVGYSVMANGAGMKELVVATGYSAEILRELADALSRHLEGEGPGGRRVKLMDDRAVQERRVKVEEESEKEGAPGSKAGSKAGSKTASQASRAERDAAMIAAAPSGTKIGLERNADGLTMTIPPVGVWKNKAGLFTFGLMWCGFMAVFTIGMVSVMVFGEGESHSDLPGIWGPVAAVLFILLFWAIGVGMLLAGWQMGRRRAMIDVVGDTLLVTRTGPLGTKQMEWPAEEIRSIAMGASGIESNDVPIMALVVTLRGGKAVNLMTGRPVEELGWAAAVLRGALGVSEEREEDLEVDEADGAIEQPRGSRVGVERRGGAVTLRVPRIGIGRAMAMLIVGFIFGGIGLGVMIGVLWSELSKQHWDWSGIGFIILWGTLFAGAGVAMFIGGCVYATRRFTLDASAGSLRIERRGLLGRKVFELRGEQIASIEVADSGMRTGNTSWYQLRVTTDRGKKIKIGMGREVEELRWMVWELRRGTGLGNREAASGPRPRK